MGHDEAPVGLFNADQLVLTEQIALPPGKAGRIIVSGAKILLDNGTTWRVVTSA